MENNNNKSYIIDQIEEEEKEETNGTSLLALMNECSDNNNDNNNELTKEEILMKDVNEELERRKLLEEINEDGEDIIIGIDLGTSTSCCCVWRNGTYEIINDKYGNKTMPSVVSYTNKQKYVGCEGKNQTSINASNTFYEVKRLIGRKYNDPMVELEKEFLNYEIEKDMYGEINLVSKLDNNRKFRPEEISAQILMELKGNAEEYLNKSVKRAVITVPAYFNDYQRQATLDAAQIAGIQCVRIINEPTAASLAYGMDRISKYRESMNILVYDLGGGTLDCSLLNIGDGIIEVLGSSGNTHIGGADFDRKLILNSINVFKKMNNLNDIQISNISYQKLRKSCENAKKILSEAHSAHIGVSDFYNGIDLLYKITREQFENMCKSLAIICMKPIDDILNNCDMNPEDVDEIIMVGGCTRIPFVRKNIKNYFNKEPNITINPDEVVAIGAGLQAHIIQNKEHGIENDILLIDVIPLSLGIETLDGIMTTLIERNTKIPKTATGIFSPMTHDQDHVNIKIYEGERELTHDNFLIGKFVLDNIRKASAGVIKIKITMHVDINGILTVKAVDTDNKENKKSIQLTGNGMRMTKEQIEELLDEAIKLEAFDKVTKIKKETYYDIIRYCDNILLNIDSHDNILSEDDISYIKEDIDKISKWIQEKHYSMRRKNSLTNILHKIQKKYGTLVIDFDNTNKGDLKNYNKEKEHGTSVFGRDEDEIEDENTTLMKIIDTDSFYVSNENERNEMIKLRDQYEEMCNMVYEILSYKNLNIDNDKIEEIKTFINDSLLWIHVQEKIKKDDYLEKINELNSYCDNLTKDNDALFSKTFDDPINKKEELEQLCYSLKSSIMCGIFGEKKDMIDELDKIIDDTLTWLMNIEINSKKLELDINNDQKIILPTFDDFQNKIDFINNECGKIYKYIHDINIFNNTTISILDV